MKLEAYIIKSDKGAVLYRTKYDSDEEIGYELSRSQLFPAWEHLYSQVLEILKRVQSTYPAHSWSIYKISVY